MFGENVCENTGAGRPRRSSRRVELERHQREIEEDPSTSSVILHHVKRMSSVTKVKLSSYIAQYPVLMTIQSSLLFTSLTDLFTQTPLRLLWEASSHTLQLMREGCSYTYPPLSIVRYSFIQLSELEQCRVKKICQGFNTAAQDSNPGSCSQESEALPLFMGHFKDIIYFITDWFKTA